MFLNNFTQLLIFLFVAFITIKFINQQNFSNESKKYDTVILSQHNNMVNNFKSQTLVNIMFVGIIKF